MKSTYFLLSILILCLTGSSVAQEAQTFVEAKQQSLEQNKPLLIEFFREE